MNNNLGSTNKKQKILFLCTGNSCRSQMAEGWAKKLKTDIFDVYSAGIETHGLNPYAVEVMAEAGVDISMQKSQCIDSFNDIKLDILVTVCTHAHHTCRTIAAKHKIIHVGFDDPPSITKGYTNKDEILEVYRIVRDQIRTFVEGLPNSLST
ncbi:MAG: arsenate reductase ArsC [Pseudomonadota bacterium]